MSSESETITVHVLILTKFVHSKVLYNIRPSSLRAAPQWMLLLNLKDLPMILGYNPIITHSCFSGFVLMLGSGNRRS